MRLALVASVLFVVSCQNKCPEPIVAVAPTASVPDAGPVTDPKVAEVLDDWHDAAAKADEKRYFDHFAEGAVFLGTDGKERWTLPQFRAFAQPHFAKGKAWTMTSSRREITFHGDTAWFDEDLKSASLGAARGSGVLIRTSSGWKIAQYNLSAPIPNERFKDVREVIEHGLPAPTPMPTSRQPKNPGY